MKSTHDTTARGRRNEQAKSAAEKGDALLLVGAPETDSDIRYITGFQAPDPVIVLRRKRRCVVVVSELELGRAKDTIQHAEVLSPSLLGLNAKQRRSREQWMIALLKREEISMLCVAATFPLKSARILEENGFELSVSELSQYPRRDRKSPRELADIRRTQQAAVIAMRFAVAVLSEAGIRRNGVLHHGGKTLTSEGLRRRINGILLEHDCFCNDMILAAGLQSADPHQAGAGPLRAHVPIVIDIFPRSLTSGYWGDLTRTVVKGTASPEIRRMYRAVIGAQEAALREIRSGVSCRRVHEAAVREFDFHGYRTHLVDGRPQGFIHSTGHGVGLDIHEEPALTTSRTRLKKGNVVTVEPGLYYPSTGGMRIEDTVVVTREGWQYLVPCEKRLEV